MQLVDLHLIISEAHNIFLKSGLLTVVDVFLLILERIHEQLSFQRR